MPLSPTASRAYAIRLLSVTKSVSAQQLWEIGKTMQDGQDKLYGADATQRALAEVFITIGIPAAAWCGVELALAGEISTLTDLPAVIAVSIVGFYTPVGMANNYTDFRVSLIAARRLFAMMDQSPAVHETAKSAVTGQVEPSLHFRNVHFEYDADDVSWSRQKKVFDGFTLDAEGQACRTGRAQRHRQVHGREPAAPVVGSAIRPDPDR